MTTCPSSSHAGHHPSNFRELGDKAYVLPRLGVVPFAHGAGQRGGRAAGRSRRSGAGPRRWRALLLRDDLRSVRDGGAGDFEQLLVRARFSWGSGLNWSWAFFRVQETHEIVCAYGRAGMRLVKSPSFAGGRPNRSLRERERERERRLVDAAKEYVWEDGNKGVEDGSVVMQKLVIVGHSIVGYEC